MTFAFRPAVRDNVGLLIGLCGPSGSGKTFTAMRLAAGIVGKGNRFAVIDTEANRALHYADQFDFDHGSLRPPFRPSAYIEAIRAADAAGYKAIVIDSMTHEWAGEGGVIDWQEEELDRMAGTDYGKRERCKMSAWIKPKMGHKEMVQKFLQVRAHLIFCLRAEEKTKLVKNDKGKDVPVSAGFQPVCAKDFMFEMTASFLFEPDRAGYPIPIKLQEQHRKLFPLDRPVSEQTGEGLAVWANGGVVSKALNPAPQPEASPVETFPLIFTNKKTGEVETRSFDLDTWLLGLEAELKKAINADARQRAFDDNGPNIIAVVTAHPEMEARINAIKSKADDIDNPINAG